MPYRPLGGTGVMGSAYGCDATRLPLQTAKPADIDVTQAVRLIRIAADAEGNTLDTAHPYPGARSEIVVGIALRDGDRGRVKLATKLPSRLVKTAGDFDTLVRERLARLETDRIDYCLPHGLDASPGSRLRDLEILKRAGRAVHGGRIGDRCPRFFFPRPTPVSPGHRGRVPLDHVSDPIQLQGRVLPHRPRRPGLRRVARSDCGGEASRFSAKSDAGPAGTSRTAQTPQPRRAGGHRSV